VSVLLPWRLVVALLLAFLVVDESLSALQLLGALVVMISIGAYLWKQYELSKARQQASSAMLLPNLPAPDPVLAPAPFESSIEGRDDDMLSPDANAVELRQLAAPSSRSCPGSAS